MLNRIFSQIIHIKYLKLTQDYVIRIIESVNVWECIQVILNTFTTVAYSGITHVIHETNVSCNMKLMFHINMLPTISLADFGMTNNVRSVSNELFYFHKIMVALSV